MLGIDLGHLEKLGGVGRGETAIKILRMKNSFQLKKEKTSVS